jgi:hypothetical protein
MTDQSAISQYCQNIDKQYRADPDKRGQWLGGFLIGFSVSEDDLGPVLLTLLGMGYDVELSRSKFPMLGTADNFPIVFRIRARKWEKGETNPLTPAIN